MPHATTYAALRNVSTDDLVRMYDDVAQNTDIGLNFLREEIARRDLAQETAAMSAMTKQMRDYIVFIAVLTVVNVIAAVILLSR